MGLKPEVLRNFAYQQSNTRLISKCRDQLKTKRLQLHVLWKRTSPRTLKGVRTWRALPSHGFVGRFWSCDGDDGWVKSFHNGGHDDDDGGPRRLKKKWAGKLGLRKFGINGSGVVRPEWYCACCSLADTMQTGVPFKSGIGTLGIRVNWQIFADSQSLFFGTKSHY